MSKIALLACTLAGVGLSAYAATENVIFNFHRFPGGANPYGNLYRARNGGLFGTTYEGGQANLGALFEFGGGGYKVLYGFRGSNDGANPFAGVVQDSAGNLYGTTYFGGPANAGVLYKVAASGQETVLYAFTGGADGGNPYAGIILDSAGNLYGTTVNGGLTNCPGGCGVAYKVTPSGQETVLYSFTGGADGANPYAGLIRDPAGNLYGTTSEGGGSGGAPGGGVVYKLSPTGQETVLHTFGSGSAAPPGVERTGIVRDSTGNLYGTDSGGVYEIEANGRYKSLATFYCKNIGDDEYPWSGLTLDSAGNLYGTTTQTFTGPCSGPKYGVVYKLTPAGRLTTLYEFPGASAWDFGGPPTAPAPANPGVVLDSAGTIYGITPNGGVSGMIYKIGASGVITLHNFTGAASGTGPDPVAISPAGGFYGSTFYGGPANAGVVYEIDSGGREKVLYSFTGGADGKYPNGPVARDSGGNIYGATSDGGAANLGVVYKVTPSGQFTLLHSFTGGADGAIPESGVILGSDGNLYGSTTNGGTGSQTGVQEGVIFKMDTAGNETVMYSFTGLADGGTPLAVPTMDAAGDLYGTATSGGAGAGVVYKLSAAGQYTVLHTFTGPGAGGGDPVAPVTLDSAGNLYGAAEGWGITASGAPGEGLVYQLSPSGIYTVLYTFSGGADGGLPGYPVVLDKAGNLYGCTGIGGGTGNGVVFEVTSSGKEIVLHSFSGGADGAGGGWLVLDGTGGLYGSAWAGATQGGLVFKITP